MTIQSLPHRAARAPLQDRSKASLERMLATAETIMAERGSDEFTLNEVGKRGKVSIGSIYCRFESKEDLVRAVQERVLQRVDAELLSAIGAAQANTQNLQALIRELVEKVSESLRKFSDSMRPFMFRASTDPIIAAIGKRSYARTSQAFQDAVLAYRADIRHTEPEHAADASFRILYACLARYLGFGSSMDAAGEGNWTLLKRDLTEMVTAYLLTHPAPAAT